MVYFLFPYWLEQQAMESIVARARTTANSTAFNISPALHFGDQVSARSVIQSTRQNRDIVYILVFDDTNEEFVAFNRRIAEEVNFQTSGRDESTIYNLYRMTTPILHNGQKIGQLYLGFSLSDLHQQIHAFRMAVGATSGLFFVLGITMVFGLSTVLSNPLNQMVETIQRIEQGDLSLRAPVISRDEIGQVARSFNRMVETLQNLYHELEDANRNLENRVAERTQELTIEIQERKLTQEALQLRVKLERLVSEISARFINLEPDWIDAGIEDALARIGESLDLDRGYVFQLQENGASVRNTHEWCDEEITPQKAHLTAVPFANFPWFRRIIETQQPVKIDRVADLPAEAASERAVYEAEEIQSLLSVPMIYQNRLRGFLGYVTIRREIRWTPELVTLIKMVGDIFVSALERRQAERVLQSLKSAIETVQVGVTITDKNGLIQYTNPAEAEMHGYRVEELIGQDVGILAPPERRERLWGETAQHFEAWHRESVNLHRDGTEFPVNLISSSILNQQGQSVGMVTVCEDITERKHNEEALKKSREELRNLSEYLQTIREDERTNIAREIHDELGQTLTGLQMDLFWLKGKLTDTQAPLSRKIDDMSATVANTIETVQRISSDLRPGILDTLGLDAAVEWYASQFQERTGVECQTYIDLEDVHVEKKLSTTVFRIVQEALTNIARHAKASSVDLTLRLAPGKIVIRVRDNGIGIRKDDLTDPKALGIIGIRERLIPWQGTVKWVGIQDKGTIVRVMIPFEAHLAE